jgi:L-2,4-diaminobutyrate transaminase
MDDIVSADRRYFFHPGTHAHDHAVGALQGRVIVQGKGIRLTDIEGRSYIDGFAGLYCVNVGYGRTEIAEVLREQSERLSFYHTYLGNTNPPAVELSKCLIEEWAPPSMAKVFYGMSGSDANDTQVKLVWYYNNVLGRKQKKKIIARQRGYHGSSIVTASLTGLPAFHANYDAPVDRILHTMCADFYRNAADGMSEAAFTAQCVDVLEKLILAEGPETVAAFIAEPVLGSGGIVPPPVGYWPAVQAVLRKYDILLIADEVVCGFGRLGAKTGCERYGIEPDLITVAKGLTSAYVPLSGVIVSEAVWQVILRGSREHGMMGHGWTYSSHPLGAAAALKNLEIMTRERLVENARDIGAYFLARLQATFGDHPMIGNVRGVGLLLALEFMQDKRSRRPFPAGTKVSSRVVAAAMNRGLIVRALGDDIVGFAPPLIVTRVDVDEMVAIIRAAVEDTAYQMASVD